MKIKRVLLIFAATLAVTGCAPSVEGITESLGLQEESVSGDVSVEDEAVSSETTENTTEAEAEASAVEEAKVEGEPVSDEELSAFTTMFIDDLHGYFGFLWPEYNSPEEIKFDQVIGCHTSELTVDDLTDEEKMEFYNTIDIEGYIVDPIVRKTDLIKYIKNYTGLDVSIDAKDVPSWTYNEKYDSFIMSGDANPWGQDSPLYDGKFVSGTKAGDTYTLTFQPNNENWGEESKQPERIITFTKSGDKLVFKSNKFGNK